MATRAVTFTNAAAAMRIPAAASRRRSARATAAKIAAPTRTSLCPPFTVATTAGFRMRKSHGRSPSGSAPKCEGDRQDAEHGEALEVEPGHEGGSTGRPHADGLEHGEHGTVGVGG